MPSLRAADPGGQQRALLWRTLTAAGCEHNIQHLSARPGPPADTAAQHSSPPWHIICPPLQTLAEPHSWFSCTAETASASRSFLPCQILQVHLHICWASQNTLEKTRNKHFSFIKERCSSSGALKVGREQEGSPSNSKGTKQTSCLKFYIFFLLCSIIFHPMVIAQLPQHLVENGPFPWASFSSKKRGKVITDCWCAKNTGKWRQGKVMHDNKRNPAIHFCTPGLS